MSTRMVNCKKFNKEAEGLDSPPFGGELGELIYNNISKDAWQLWSDDMMIKIINEYRLNLSDPDNYNTLLEQMCAFLNLEWGEIGKKKAVLEVENADRGKN